MMTSFEATVEAACKDGIIPGAVMLASNKSGTFTYAKTFGVRSLSTKQPMEMDTIMWIASCTKLMTTIATLQCIERGLLNLDDDVSKTLPELASLEILTGFDQAGKPVLRERENAIILRHLLTHTAGLAYEFSDPTLQNYLSSISAPFSRGSTIRARFSPPLLYEPGTGWSYGPAIDWAGLLIERVTGQSLEEIMKTNIWDPLGITDITFWTDTHPEMKSRMADMSAREVLVDGEGRGQGKTVHEGPLPDMNRLKDAMGGQGCFASIPDFFKVLMSLLRDDGKLLKPETVGMMFTPQLSKESQQAQTRTMHDPEASKSFVGNFPPHVGLDWGFGGILTTQKDEGESGRGIGTLMWSGMPNLFWWIDREMDLCGLIGMQITPPGDEKAGEVIGKFEGAMYGMYERVGGVRGARL